MIKNVVFDIGGVLTKFDPNDYLSPFEFEKKKSLQLNNAIFKSPAWRDYIIGKVDKNQFKEIVIRANANLREEIAFVLSDENTKKLLPPLDEGIALLKELKGRGYNIYILSNIVGASLEYFKKSFEDVTQLLSGGIYSCEVGLHKPDEKIFNLLLNRYNLKPQETMFLDDSFKNVEAAKALGINGILCQPLKDVTAFENVKKFIDGMENENLV